MGYPRDLDEYSEEELAEEVRQRATLRAQGKCDYCKGTDLNRPCRFPDRHRLLHAEAPTKEGLEPKMKLVLWLRDHVPVLEEVARELKLALPKCEGHRQACPDGIVLWSTPALTQYAWDGEGEDPNRGRELCSRCAQEYDEDWRERWAEYYASVR